MYSNIIGVKIGRLLPKRYYKKGDSIFYTCFCDCGNTKDIRRGQLTRKDGKGTRSCGCIHKEGLSKMFKKHGLTETRFYTTWANMKKRILDKNAQNYKFYGGRGIKICNEWLAFENFMNDMYASYLVHSEKHGEKNTKIDRIDPDGNYEPNNCRWATHLQQSNNQRRHKKTIQATNIKTGQTHIGNSQTELARFLGISHNHISCVLRGERKTTQGFKFEYIN